MAKKAFEIGNARFESQEQVTFNGTTGRFWTLRTLVDGGWALQGAIFFPTRATRKDIADGNWGVYTHTPVASKVRVRAA